MSTRIKDFGYINEGRDLLRAKKTYIFQSHFITIWLLHICGFTFADKKTVYESTLEAQLRLAIPFLRKAIDKIIFEFEIPHPNLNQLAQETDKKIFLTKILKFINTILRRMYGIQIQRKQDLYYLGQNNIGKRFVFSHEPESDDIKGGPRPHIPSNLITHDIKDNRVNNFIDYIYYNTLDNIDSLDDPYLNEQLDNLINRSLNDEPLIDESLNNKLPNKNSDDILDQVYEDY